MAEVTEGASGPQQDNAAPVSSKSDALDKALAAAFEGQNVGGDDYPPQVLQKKKEADDRKNDNAGLDRTSEDAGDTSNKAEATPAEATPAGVPEPREAPKHWPEERRKAFAGWPKEVQDHALSVDKDLQAGFTRKSQELSDQAKFAESVRGLIKDHHRQQLSQAGLDEVGGFQYLLQLQDYATRDPVGYARWFMQQQGITPEHLGFSSPTRQPEPQHRQQPQPSTGDPQLDQLLADPEVARLRSEFGQFSQAAVAEINALKAERAAQAQAQYEYAQRQHVAAVQSLQKQWTDFRSAQDDHGQLAYPHADALMKPMGALMETHPFLSGMPDGPDNLAKAYAMALQADPELSKPIFEAEVSKRLAEQQRKSDADKAKRAASVRPATGAPTVPGKKGGIDAALDAAFAKVGMQ